MAFSTFEQIDAKIKSLDGISMDDLISFFKIKCKVCGHHRVMHDAVGVCGGVMNKPCTFGCDGFIAE